MTKNTTKPSQPLKKKKRKGIQDVQKPRQKTRIARPEEFIPSGCTVFDCALSGPKNAKYGGWLLGTMANLIGDSHTGKTALALTMLAECANDNRFDGYDFIYDDVESACCFNINAMFGDKAAERIEPPKYDGDGLSVYSDTMIDFRDNVIRKANGEKPFIYVLDSFDALSDSADGDIEKAIVAEDDKVTTGGYNMGKPKEASRMLRMAVKRIQDSKSFLVIISQTRDKINSQFAGQKTRSGGRALKFYATHEVWLSQAKAIEITRNGKKTAIGSNVNSKVTKSKVTGKIRKASFAILDGYGVDDIGAMIDYAVDEKIMTKPKNLTVRGDLIEELEANEEDFLNLKSDVLEAWQAYEDVLKPGRVSKYD